MKCSDRQFWQLTKEIGDIAQNKAVAAPRPEALAEHFAHKIIRWDSEDFLILWQAMACLYSVTSIILVVVFSYFIYWDCAATQSSEEGSQATRVSFGWRRRLKVSFMVFKWRRKSMDTRPSEFVVRGLRQHFFIAVSGAGSHQFCKDASLVQVIFI